MEKYIVDAFIYFYTYFRLDMTKWAGRVGFGLGQSGRWLK